MSEAIVKKDERSEVSSLSEAIMTAHDDNNNISIKELNTYHQHTPILGVTKIKKQIPSSDDIPSSRLT